VAGKKNWKKEGRPREKMHSEWKWKKCWEKMCKLRVREGKWGGLGWCFLVLLCEEVEARLQCEKKNLEISATTAAADKRRRQQRAVVGVGGV